MRKILFRGKRKGNNNEWLYGDLNHIDLATYIFPRTDDAPLNSTDWFEVQPETVGQFTGLTDKNGVKIFEGDELNTRGNFVEFSFGCWNINGDRALFNTMEYNIIGNIHDNFNQTTKSKIE